ncbi:MAG: hypothetical protein FWB77_04280 [Treponema sp.]|nr:hypothetical protein [Treponema sp.]
MEFYRNHEKRRIISLIEKGWFNNDPGDGMFVDHNHKYVLKNSDNNFYPPILRDVKDYFKYNEINWWRGFEPTGHTMSSQTSCLNHLYHIRNDKEAVMAVLSSFSNCFTDVIQIITDKFEPAYISFEQVSDNDLLSEGLPKRGSICTSIDAFIYALHRNGSKWLIPIEWKYIESYNDTDKSTGPTGEIRRKRYDELIFKSSQLIYDRLSDRKSCYYYMPFYQLMRQTLWAEQMINHNNIETISAENFLHLNVVPYKNIDLLERRYSCSKNDLPTTWRSCLSDQSKYKIISPEMLLSNLGYKYHNLKQYLSARYWND